jgi:predicted RNA-binding protein with RPS1 domain
MNDTNFQLAHTIAERLVRANTDHNELSKASAYLSQTRDAKAFFTWLDWMATPRVSEKLARSRQTPEYYRQIRDACQSLHQISDVTEMAQTLGWAVRLMRYMPYARPISPQELDASLAGKPAAAPTQRRSEGAAAPPRTRLNISDLRPGMQLTGTVKRTANFGAFVDVGVGRDGLVHISKLKQGYVSSTDNVVQEGQQVTVWVESVEPGQRKISLTMIPPKGGARPVETAPASQPKSAPPVTKPQPAAPRPQAVRLSAGDKPEPGKLVIGKLVRIEPSRLVVDIGLREPGSLTFDRMPGKPSREDVEDQYEDGQQIDVWIQGVNKQGRVQLTLLKPQ